MSAFLRNFSIFSKFISIETCEKSFCYWKQIEHKNHFENELIAGGVTD